jgi:G:T-mismatch repair DNA endonuclease (very short patch repair protein)
MGWSYLVLWECEVTKGSDLLERLQSFLKDTDP